ncbi:MAG: MBL fold metallo-hydrolase [Actinobacteria bacterium]|nr:MBL fold metallo-hydrolase [Actinomycetota bacterium]
MAGLRRKSPAAGMDGTLRHSYREEVGNPAMRITFHGVRGSTPCHGPDTAKYGGNTACVSVEVDGEEPILCDLGTGFRYFGRSWWERHGSTFCGTALVTHLHWDHIMGLPFFSPLISANSHLTVYGPRQEDGSFEDAVRRVVQPPTFPVTLDEFPGSVTLLDIGDESMMVGDVRVLSRFVPHIGPTLGFRIEHAGRSVAYVSDHQQPVDGSFSVPPSVRELAEGVDLLIHDAQYTTPEFAHKAHWGHSTQEYAVALAASCGVGRLAMFHHDPERTDAELDCVASCAGSTLEVFAAREGLVLEL